MTPTSSGFSDFFSQIGGLIALTCGAGLIWVILMALVAQRASERRRRSREGLPPLPGIHTQALNLLRRSTAPQTKILSERRTVPAVPSAPPRSRLSVPAPDLDMLTSDLPQPDLSAIFEDVPSEEPVEETHAMPEMPDLEASFPLDTAEPAAPRAGTPPPQDSVELLRVWRDLSDGRLIVEIGGRRFTSLGELRSADLERRFLSVLRDLEAMVQPAAPAAPPPAAKPARADKPMDAPPPSMRPGAMFRQMGRVAIGQSAEPSEERANLSIADQIEELLQERLSENPAYRARSIHVKPSFSGGVRIEVDGKFYEGIGDVDETAVRELLQSVVREWESRQ